MRPNCNGLLVALLLAAAPAVVSAQDPAKAAASIQVPAPAVAPPPPSMDDPGQPATAESIKPDDPRLAPLPPESAPVAPAPEPPPGPSKTDGDPSNLPRIPTDDAFHPPPKSADEKVTANGDSVRVHIEPNGDRVEEYRHDGLLTKVKVKPAGGLAYELDDTKGNQSNSRSDVTANQVAPVQWTLFQWH